MASPETHLLSHDGGTTFSVPWAAGSGYTAAADYPQPIEPLRILHMDADIVVVIKPAFLPTENTKLIKDSVRSRIESELIVRGESAEGLHVAHRLDWETSGLLVLARHRDAMRSLTRQFAERTISKAYTADVLGAPPQLTGVLELPLATDARNPPRQCVDLREGKGGGKPATTRWAVLPAADGGTTTAGGGGGSTDGGGGAGGDANGTDVGAGDCGGGGGGETAAESRACARLSTWPESGPECNLAPTEISSRLHLWPESGRCHQLCQRTPIAAAHVTTHRSRAHQREARRLPWGGVELVASKVVDAIAFWLPPQASPAAATPARTRMPHRGRLPLRPTRWLPPHSGKHPLRPTSWWTGHARFVFLLLLSLLSRNIKAAPTREQPWLCTPGQWRVGCLH